MIYTNNNNNDSNIGAIIGSVRSFVSNLLAKNEEKREVIDFACPICVLCIPDAFIDYPRGLFTRRRWTLMKGITVVTEINHSWRNIYSIIDDRSDEDVLLCVDGNKEEGYLWDKCIKWVSSSYLGNWFKCILFFSFTFRFVRRRQWNTLPFTDLL